MIEELRKEEPTEMCRAKMILRAPWLYFHAIQPILPSCNVFEQSKGIRLIL